MLKRTASLLAAITAVVHIAVGGAGALTPTLAAGLSLPVEGAMHACWHMASALFSIIARHAVQFLRLYSAVPAVHGHCL